MSGHWVRLGNVPTSNDASKLSQPRQGWSPMDTLKKLAGMSIVKLVTTYSLLLVMFPVGWIVLLGLVIAEPREKKSVDDRIFGADVEV